MLLLLLTALALPPATRDAVALGDCAAVTAALPNPTAPDERLAVGWCLRSQDPARAEAVLAPLTSGPLADHARLLRAEAAHARGDAKATESLLKGLRLPGEAGDRVRILRARALLAQGRSLDARPDLRDLLSTDAGAEARYLLAQGAADRGDLPPAIATWRRTWASTVRGGWDALSAEALARHDHPVPAFTTAEDRQLVRDRIDALRKAHLHAEALELHLKLREAEGRTEPDLELARFQFRGRAYPDAVATWAATLGPAQTARGGPTELFDYALGLSRTGDYDRAATVYQRLIDAHPGHAKAVEAHFKLGYLPYDKGDCGRAVPLLDAHLKAHPSSPFYESAMWFAAWCPWRSGEQADAVARFQRIVQERPSSVLAPAAAYWLAVSQDNPDALRHFANTHPRSGHAWIARRQLGLSTRLRPAVPRPDWPASFASRPEVQRAEALLDAGFRAWAAAELAPLEATAKAADRSTRLAFAHALHAAGAFKDGIRLAKPFCGDPATTEPIAAQACWPRPEASLVTRTAEQVGIPPLLPYAIMWAESRMTPDVTSIAGARGIMQLMPEEAERLHTEVLQLPGPFDSDRLFLAPYNALLGITLLGEKLAAYDGQLTPHALPAAIAAYNGGSDAVTRWLSAYEALPVDAARFSEDVGYTETRRYVRSVLSYLRTWEQVYEE